ncbi:hypothetical protein TWF506_009048 [Arthrobotrys conoides]|uniref:Inhibitor I9 domain-containing protein n=1 Tax=Arthrobotrys conoides TaxID=74498 RepID=A0AAN8N864_9PEZI
MSTTYIITVKEGENKQEVIDHITDLGGKVTHNYSLIHAFAAEIPDDHVSTFGEHPLIQTVEKDQEVRTQ